MSLKIGTNGVNYEVLSSMLEAAEAVAEVVEEQEEQEELEGYDFNEEGSEVLYTAGDGSLAPIFKNDVSEVLRKRALLDLLPKEDLILNTGPLIEPRDNFLPKLSLPKGLAIEDEHAGLRPPLYVKGPQDANEVDMNDVDQEGIGNCWMMGPLAELAKKDPDAIKRMIKDNGDGTYTVTFKERIPVPGSADIVIDRPITVSGDLFQDVQLLPYLDPISPHGAPGDKNARGQGEIWPLIIEKAYAQYKGNYSNYFFGGNPVEMMEALTGQKATRYNSNGSPRNGGITFEELKNQFEAGRNVVFSTGKIDKPMLDFEKPYKLIDHHCYAVQRVYVDEKGRKMVQLYNPHGKNQPDPIPYEEASRYFTEIDMN